MKHVPREFLSKRILVTGGAGFIGQHLVGALVAAGYAPTATTRSRSKVKTLAPDCRKYVAWRELDLLDSRETRETLKVTQPEILFHLAGTRGETDACLKLNAAATGELLERAQQWGVERIVILGSADEYGKRAGQLGEHLEAQPVSPYAVSKAVATRHALALYETSGCPVVIVRPFTVYGPHQPPAMFVAEAIECAVTGQPFRMSAGKQRRDLVYVSDVVRALVSAASAPSVEGKIINIASGRAESLIDIARLIWQLSESSAPLLVGERPASPEETHDTWADISLAGELLDWKPQIGIEEGLRETIEWARARFLQGQQKELTNWL